MGIILFGVVAAVTGVKTADRAGAALRAVLGFDLGARIVVTLHARGSILDLGIGPCEAAYHGGAAVHVHKDLALFAAKTGAVDSVPGVFVVIGVGFHIEEARVDRVLIGADRGIDLACVDRAAG